MPTVAEPPARDALAADDRPGLFTALAAEAMVRGRSPVPKPHGEPGNDRWTQ